MRAVAGIAAAALLAGCAAIAPTKFAAKTTRPAIVEWKTGGESVELRAEFSTGEGDAIQLVVFRERPVLVLARMKGTWTASGVLSGGAWRGTWNTVPRALGGWLCLAEALEGGVHAPEGNSEFRIGRMSVRYAKSGGEVRVIELAAVATDDRFRVRLQDLLTNSQR